MESSPLANVCGTCSSNTWAFLRDDGHDPVAQTHHHPTVPGPLALSSASCLSPSFASAFSFFRSWRDTPPVAEERNRQPCPNRENPHGSLVRIRRFPNLLKIRLKRTFACDQGSKSRVGLVAGGSSGRTQRVRESDRSSNGHPSTVSVSATTLAESSTLHSHPPRAARPRCRDVDTLGLSHSASPEMDSPCVDFRRQPTPSRSPGRPWGRLEACLSRS